MKPRKKTKSFALALRLRARAATLLIALLCGVTGAWAQVTLTVYDGKGTNQYIPMDGYDFNCYTKSECIIPASELTAMTGGTITAITFYAKSVENSTWGTANQKVFLKEVTGTTLSSFSGMTDATVVFNGLLPMPTTSTDGYTITFSQGYTYNGGNLLIGVYNDAIGSYNNVIWYGNSNQSSGVSAYGLDASSLANCGKDNQSFLPKTTFTYTIPTPPTPVDLGLPSGKKWADMNVGAGSETGYGTYYAWSSSDIATAQWGNDWRMPTLTEAQELINNTDQEWATIGGVNGTKFMKKTDHSVYIFVPAAGWDGSGNGNIGTAGAYWTSTAMDESRAYEFAIRASGNATGYDNMTTHQFTIRPVQMFAGEGTQASPYLIASTTDWNNLVSAVNAGETYSGNYFKMTANVGTVSTWMTGTFSGTFDGDGNTLTVDYSATTENCAPFGTLSGATIQKLKVAGSISSNQKLVAGIAALCSSTGNSVTNCLVSATINSSYNDNAADGGLVAVVDNGASLNVTGCAFAGKLLTTNGTTSCGGIVGWRRPSGTVTITNCLYAPTSATGSETWIASADGEKGNANFCRWNSSEPTITNCYYTTDFGSGDYTAQGLQARTIDAGDYVSALSVTKGSATATYAVSGITVYSGGIDFNDGSTTTFYGGSGQTVSLALTAETRTGYQFKQYAASQGTLSGQTTNAPTLTMPGATGETLYTSYTATAGPSGYAKLVDNDKSTKVCTTFTSGVYIDFNTPNAIVPTGYVITTANDASSEYWRNRSPKTWKLYGKLNEGDSWTVLDDVADGNLPNEDTTDKSYSIANTTAYKYFRYEISAIKGSTELFQLAELQLKGYDAVTISAEYDPTYNATFADGIDDNGWTISPSSATAGQTVTISYTGSRTITSVSAVKKPFGLSTFSFATPARGESSNLTFTGASTEKPVWFTGTVDTHNTTGTVVYNHSTKGSYDLLSFNGVQFYEGGWDVPGALYITGGLGTEADPFVLSTTSSPAPDMELTVTSAGEKSWTITMPTSDVEIQVLMPYTVTLADDNTKLTEASGGAGVTLPSRSDIGSYTFAGWSTTNETEETTTAPTIIATGEYHPTSDITLYPVYTRTESSVSEVVDVLNRELTGVTKNNTSYSEWSGKTATSSAVYKGQSAGGNDAIQLRSDNSNSGIVTTASGGKVKKVSISWNSNTNSARKVDVYGKNSAYSAASDLYSTGTQGTKLGTIQCSPNVDLTISGDYEYIGLRSNDGALYLSEVEITWSSGSFTTYYTSLPRVSLSETTDNSEMLTALNGETCTVTLDRTLTAGIWNTFASPVAITNLSIFGTYAKVRQLKESSVSDNVLTITFEDAASIEAGKPYLVKPKDENVVNPTLEAVTITAAAPVSVTTDYVDFVPTLGKTEVTGDPENILMMTTEGKLVHPSALGNMKGFRAYFKMHEAAASQARAFVINFGEGETTGIQPIRMENGTTPAEGTYDLSGRRIQGQPTQKGVYIQNGKKVVIK